MVVMVWYVMYVCYRFQPPRAQFSPVSAVFLHGPRSVMELAVARFEGNDSALSRARLGKPGETFSHEASKNDTTYCKVYQKGKKDTADGRNPKQPPGK